MSETVTAEGSSIVDALAGIFVGQIGPGAVAASGGGSRSTAEIKAALNAGSDTPAVAAAYPKVKAALDDRLLRYANQRAGVFSMLGGDPSATSPDLNIAYDALVERRTGLERDIGLATAEADRVALLVAAEPGANLVLDGRIKLLAGAGFGVGYFDNAFAALQPPATEPGDAIDVRDQGRKDLTGALVAAEAFKLHLTKLADGDKALAGYPQVLRDGYAKSRPKLPEAGIATAQDLVATGGAEVAIAPWAKAVADASVYLTAREGFVTASTQAKVETGAAAAAIARVRDGADKLAGEAAAGLASLGPASAALDGGKTTVEAAGRFMVIERRIGVQAAAFSPRIKLLADWCGSLSSNAVDADKPEAALFDQAGKDLEEAEAGFPKAIAYAKAHDEAEAAYAKFKAGVKRPVPQPVTTAQAGIDDVFKAVATSATGMEYDAATVGLKDVVAKIQAAVLARAAALLPADSAARKVHTALVDAKDTDGSSLVSRLYTEFGEADFPRLLAGMTGAKAGAVANSPDAGLTPEKAAENLAALGLTLGVKGLKEMTGVLGGRTDAAFKGAGNLGTMMNAGMTTKQVADLHEGFGLGDPAGAAELTRVFATGFNGDARTLATVTARGLKTQAQADVAMPGQAADDPRRYDAGVVNLRRLGAAFPDAAQLKNLVDGVKSPDPGTPTIGDFGNPPAQERTRIVSKLEAEQSLVTARRMQGLLIRNAGGDPAKLKTPFYDQVNAAANAEYDTLNAAWQTNDAYQNRPVGTVGPAPPPFTPQMLARLQRLHNAPIDHTARAVLIRNAATLTRGWTSPDDPPPPPRGVPVPQAELGGVFCTADDQAHFEERHLRACNPLMPRALASEATPAGDPQDKPATFWPEGTTPDQLKTMLKSAIASAGNPPGGGWNRVSGDNRARNSPQGRTVTVSDFYQQDVNVNYVVTAAGRQITKVLRARLGINWVEETFTPWPAWNGFQAPSQVNEYQQLTQFYPQGSGRLDTMSFEALQKMKAALGQRQWPGGGAP